MIVVAHDKFNINQVPDTLLCVESVLPLCMEIVNVSIQCIASRFETLRNLYLCIRYYLNLVSV